MNFVRSRQLLVLGHIFKMPKGHHLLSKGAQATKHLSPGLHSETLGRRAKQLVNMLSGYESRNLKKICSLDPRSRMNE